MERQRVRAAADVSGDDGDGAEFAHGAGRAEDRSVEEAPFDFGQRDLPEDAEPARSEKSRGVLFVAAMAFHERNQLLCDERHRDEKRREKQAGEGEDDFAAVGLQPCAAGAVLAEQKDEKESDDDGRHGER